MNPIPDRINTRAISRANQANPLADFRPTKSDLVAMVITGQALSPRHKSWLQAGFSSETGPNYWNLAEVAFELSTTLGHVNLQLHEAADMHGDFRRVALLG